MSEIVPILFIFAAGIVFTEIAQKFKIQYVFGLLIAGMLLGPNALDIVPNDAITNFLAFLGIVFLMFMSGIHIDLQKLKSNRENITLLVLVSCLVPFLVGFGFAKLNNYSTHISLIVACIFLSSSAALIKPLAEKLSISELRVGRTLLSINMIQDILSLVIFGIVFQNVIAEPLLPTPIFIGISLIIFLILFKIIPLIEEKFHELHKRDDFMESEFRFILVIIFSVTLIFTYLELSPIVAGFLAGLILSKNIQADKLYRKFATVAHGIFIPAFFIILGIQLEISMFLKTEYLIFAVILIVLFTISKVVGVILVAKKNNFSDDESKLISYATLPQLSTTLVIAFIASQSGLFDDKLLVASILLSIFTSTLGPILFTSTAAKLNFRGSHSTSEDYFKGESFRERRIRQEHPLSPSAFSGKSQITNTKPQTAIPVDSIEDEEEI